MTSAKVNTRVSAVVDKIHGVTVADPYRWLEAIDSPEVRAWVEAQNARTRGCLEGNPARAGISQRLSELLKIGAVGVPVAKRGRYFFEERRDSEELPLLYVQRGLQDPPRALIDPNALSETRTTVLHQWSPSPDGTLLAYALSEAANDQAALYVLNVETGEPLGECIPADLYPSPYTPIEWAPDHRGFWYTRRHPSAPAGEEKFHQKVYYHELGRDFRDDPMVFGGALKREDIPSVRVSRDGRYLLVNVAIWSDKVHRSEVYLCDLHHPQQGFVPIIRDVEAECYAAFHRDAIYVQTNHNAPLGKIVAVRTEEALDGARGWATVVPEGAGPLEGFVATDDSLLVATLENVRTTLRRYRLDGTLVEDILLPTLGAVTSMRAEEDGGEVFFEFSSFLVPPIVYRTNLRRNERDVFRKLDVGIDADSFEVTQVWFSSKDGTQVPMFLVHKKGLRLDGSNPAVLYGYGGFNISMTPQFLPTIIPFIEAGGIYARAGLRGGGEFGDVWHKAGTRERKQNVFDDFIAAAEWLVTQRYTQPSRLAIFGRSNGGLLVGAAMTQRPELCRVAIIGAPVLDMARYQRFFGGRHWIPDYGSVEEPDLVRYLLAYSPYHNVREGEHHPATFIYTADRDDRVHPMHAYKMAARLQAANASGHPVLLRVEQHAGHQGGVAVSKIVDLFTDIWSFAFAHLGMQPSTGIPSS